MLHRIAEENIIQDGLIGKFLDPILKVAQSACARYSAEDSNQVNNLQRQ